MRRMLVEVFSDAVCPWCFLGKRRLELALQSRPTIDADVRWLPFELNPSMPAAGLPRQEYLAAKFGDPAVLAEAQARLAGFGREVGIDYRFDRIALVANTRAAHALTRHAETVGRQGELQEALFRAYFEAGEDIGDLDTLARLAGGAGLDAGAARARLIARLDYAAVEQIEREASAAGVSGVPFYVFDRKYAVSGAQNVATFVRVLDHVAGRADV